MRLDRAIFFGAFALFALWQTSLAAELDQGDCGFALEYPDGWAVTTSGSWPSGSLDISNQSARFSLVWMRDPGIDPEVCLNKAAEAYDGDQVSVLKRDYGSIPLGSNALDSIAPGSIAFGSTALDSPQANSSPQVSSSFQVNSSFQVSSSSQAQTMNLTYAFKGCQSKRWLAAWKSKASDRLFMASMSMLDNNTSEGDLLFTGLLSGFSDTEARSQELAPRKTADDKWAVLLQDLLSSYHYNGSSMIQPSVLHIQVSHILSTGARGYSLISEETISIDRPEDVILRPSAVLDVLKKSGYDARLIQFNGIISVIVLDPSGLWQVISINPSEPWRAIGALVWPDEINGIVCDNLSDLAEKNAADLEDVSGFDAGSYVLKDCEAPRLVELEKPDDMNQSWAKELQSVLDQHSYGERYDKSNFDCSNVSQVCWEILESSGYDAVLMFSCEEDPLGAHMWVAVKYPYQEDRYVAVEATVIDKNLNFVHLGKIAPEEEYYKGIMYNSSLQFSRLHPEEGLWLIPQSAAQSIR